MILASVSDGSLIDWLRTITPLGVKDYYWAAVGLYREPWLWLSVLLILVLERVVPVIRQQKVFSKAFFEDFVWFNLVALLTVAAFPAFVSLLQGLYATITGGHGVTPVLSTLPLWLKVVVSLVIVDLLTWVHHWVRHQGVLWRFHLIHHSQRELNQFTDFRVHAVDLLVVYGILAIPTAALHLAPGAIMSVALARAAHARFIHANIRTNLGPLRHILVTPQYHRIHHSIEPRHQDKNFGGLLTVWDRIFGTLWTKYDEYPATGVADVEFEPRLIPGGWLGAVGRELVYPFRR